LSGGAVSDRLNADEKARMLAHAADASGDLAEYDAGPLWLVSARRQFASDEHGCLAYEGFIAFAGSGRKGPADLLRRARNGGDEPLRPEGHYALAFANSRTQRLLLLRGLSGGERLYYTVIDGMVLFASSIRPLLAHGRIKARLNRDDIREILLSGLILTGNGTLFGGVEEVAPGHRLLLGDTIGGQQWNWPGLLEPREGGLKSLAKAYRNDLAAAIDLAIGTERPVAVALSGGIDSSAIAALAVEAVGARNVAAFTYEFDDPAHPSETPFAVETCRRLGIQRHHVFRISFSDYLAAIPETVWRAEHFVHWPKAFMLPAARHIKAFGHSRFLSGFGIGSHMGYFDDFARILPFIPSPGKLLLYWRLARTRNGAWLRHLARLHPGLEPPHPRLFHLLLAVLQSRGIIKDRSSFYPPSLASLIASGGTAALDERFAGMDLGAHLRHHAFAQLISCIDVTRWEKVLREIGILRSSPAHFAVALPGSYLPVRPAPFAWSADRRLRPGKLLLREAMKDVLPDAVLYRKKSWSDAVVSPRWYRAGLRWINDTLPKTDHYLGMEDPGFIDALAEWAPTSPQGAVSGLQFWDRIFFERPQSATPPRWEDLHG
jgi:hypothetical protein